MGRAAGRARSGRRFRDRSADMIRKSEFLFVDPCVPDLKTLLGHLRPQVQAIVLDHRRPAARQMAEALDGREGLEAIYIVENNTGGGNDGGSAGGHTGDTSVIIVGEVVVPGFADSGSTINTTITLPAGTYNFLNITNTNGGSGVNNGDVFLVNSSGNQVLANLTGTAAVGPAGATGATGATGFTSATGAT